MRLGGWESLDMVLRYTRSVKFEESLRLYRGLEHGEPGLMATLTQLAISKQQKRLPEASGCMQITIQMQVRLLYAWQVG